MTTPDTGIPTHPCPGPACAERAPFHMLACSPHWFQISIPVRTAIYRMRDQYGQGSPQHLAACRLGIAQMTPLPPRRQP